MEFDKSSSCQPLLKYNGGSNTKTVEEADISRSERIQLRIPGDLAEHGRDIICTVLCCVLSCLGCSGWHTKLFRYPLDIPHKLTLSEAFLYSACLIVMMILNAFVPSFGYFIGPLLDKRKIGNQGKFLVNFVGVCAAVVTRYFVPQYSIDALMALTCHTLYIHTLLRLLRFASDVSAWDVLLGTVMQIAIYTSLAGPSFFSSLGACCLVLGYQRFKFHLRREEKLMPL